ncbi:hypothetical protein I3842_04G106600 [Carya illinoinensis]|uniref:ATP-dependent DNA helicase n=1 Tax=Carya illinoinensis TaxID=32201 RepID=A0A922FD19_CARIL|nr:hypothetical protein I3842_04G106600 [Carya illinoinensis]
MNLIQHFGKPDIFLTMTCNPNWKEVLDELGPQKETQNHPDLIARIFRAKLEELKDDLFKWQIFGKVSAYFYVIEHQKRDWRIYAPESFDDIISVEIPNKDNNLHLYKSVVRDMMHGSCRILNPTNMQILDNCWVVPHNPYLIVKYDCHINVEICSTIKAVKYLYKYINKDHDHVAFNLIHEKEAMWRIYGFTLNEMYPAVYSLHLHLEDQHMVTFRALENLSNVVSSYFLAKSIGPLSFDHIKTVDGIIVPTFCEAATLHGLLKKDNGLEDCLQEASLYQMSYSLRRLFVTILVYCNPTNPMKLRKHFEKDMSTDFQTSYANTTDVSKKVLQSVSSTLESMGKDINVFHLLDSNVFFDEEQSQCKEISDELAVAIPEDDLLALGTLNSEQLQAYNEILQKALLAKIISEHLIALATASSSITASILPSGRTAHSRLLRLSRLIVWDEAPMFRKESVEAFDKMLQDINDLEFSFGGKIVVFGTRQEQINASLVASYLWPMIKKITVSENMRARLDSDFLEYLLQVCNGTSPITIEENIIISNKMFIPYTINDLESLENLIDGVFGDMNMYSNNLLQMSNRAILILRNVYVEQINAILIERFPGEIIRYYSFDETIDSSEQGIMEDFLNTLTTNGLPTHELLLKTIAPSCLCNGTCLIYRNFNCNVIDAEIAIGHYSGKRVFIPRIPFLPNTDENSGFPFKRTQFPIRLSFAMTINKSQGQILDFVGIYLPQPIFYHDQLYVAFSKEKVLHQ